MGSSPRPSGELRNKLHEEMIGTVRVRESGTDPSEQNFFDCVETDDEASRTMRKHLWRMKKSDSAILGPLLMRFRQ